MILRGVDGCPYGWIAADLDLQTGRVTATLFHNAAELFREPAMVTAIDIPIGLPKSEPRKVDGAARKLLKQRASSVFPAPVRATLEFHDHYEKACAASEAACGKRLSKQSHAILPKIKGVDSVLRSNPALLGRVFEVHPEVSFAVWAGNPMRFPKKTGFGFAERLKLIQSVFGDAAEAIREAVGQDQAGDDDILDALAALWTARRIHEGTAIRLPEQEERDELGLPMQILA